MRVADPSGKRWLVGRRVLPWRRRWKGQGLDLLDVGGGADDIVTGIVLAIAVPVAIFLTVFLGELLLLLLLALPFVLVPRVVFRRPWAVEVRPAKDARRLADVERVVGWRASRERAGQLAKAIRAGVPVEDGALSANPPS